ncbi:hypothetical protein DAEQUDRAFT_746278 [Daedalea quercina L-15889]|uniref:Homeobox domain-containing protein n=1 Tax=Daedalea quercina L-15889 TaxID=1314783 RepID=A0A165NKC4_9APHY|nr:hypothetical protein DAEQUDRAFT_746278 [Daedalea quercina L-15889]
MPGRVPGCADGFFTEPCYNLVYLELAACRLTALPAGLARLIPNVRVLNLNYNFVEDPRSLEGLTRLRKLTLIGSRVKHARFLVRVLRGMNDIEMLDFRMNPCTLGWYLPLLVRDVPGALQPSDGDRTGPNAAGSGEHGGAAGLGRRAGEAGRSQGGPGAPSASAGTGAATWKELDAKFRRDLPDEAYVGRLAYRGLVMRACPGIRLLDGVETSAKEREKAEKDLSDYDSRRMSTSATSDSSLQSRPEKRGPSPSNSPLPKKPRSDISLDPNSWSSTPSPHPHPPSEDRPEADSARVQLPSIASTFQDRYELRHNPASRLRLPPPSHRPTQSSSGLAYYQFPNSESAEASRPSGFYGSESNLSQSGSSSSFNFSPLQTDYSRSSGLSSSISSESEWSAGGIVRPNSTPSNLAGVPGLKYDDALRNPSVGSQDLFGGVTRISGHHASTDRSARQTSGIKTEEWSFPSNDFNMNPPASAPSYPSTPSTSASGIPSSASAPNMSGTNSPTRSPQSAASAASLVERPPRKRGKLPKPVTDFLKDWLHRHSDHPYPSEEEKKQLCHATGLSMSQVSNWMINARRRILAPAHRAAQGPTTTTPFSSARPGIVPSVLDTGRRASMPTDSLQLYYPMSLQNLGGDAHMPASTRHMVSMTRSLSSSNATAGSLSQQGHHGHGSSPYALDGGYSSHSRMGYGGSGMGHGHGHGSSGYGLGMSMGASGGGGLPGTSSFLGSSSSQLYGHSSGGYTQSPQSGTRMTIQQEDSQSRYTFPAHSVSPQPGPGSGYGTPQ